MALDNPSYFTVPSDEKTKSNSSLTVLKRRRMGNSESVGSVSDCSKYHRSVSTNSADSNQELLILGQPRLSDMAPDLAFKHPASRSNSLKNNKDVRKDVKYSPLATSEEEECAKGGDLSGDEVFLNEDSARYYNMQATLNRNSQRRHSIGTFVSSNVAGTSRERTSSFVTNFREEFSKDGITTGSANAIMDDHSLRHGSYPRKRCTRCTSKVSSTKSKNMDDILIVSLKSSEAATLWVDYFSNYFQQISRHANRKPFKIQHLGVEEAINCTDTNFIERTNGVKLQLIVLCPNFLEFVNGNPEQCTILGKILLSDRTLALLLGVHDSDLTDIHKKAFGTYSQWQRQSVGQDQDTNFTKEFLSQAMAILSRIWKQQSSVTAQEKTQFTVTPKKIRQGQNSVFILLTYPLQKEDIVKISIEKNGEMHEMKTVKRRNPYILKITVPENLTEITTIVNVLVEKNGNIIGSRPIKCESKLRELEQILRAANNPVEFMCQTLGLEATNERDQLDTWLTQNFLKNLPPHFNLLASHESPFAASVHAHKHSHEEFPTLLHFAAKFGLEKLAMQLLDCPGADVANEIRNIYDMTTFDMAQTNGHAELASILRGYMNMNEFSTVYAKLKAISLNPDTPEVDDEGYLRPKDLMENYKTCPKPRPVELAPISPIQSPSTPPLGYITMNTPVEKKAKPAPKRDRSPQPGTSTKQTKPTKSKPELVIEDKVQKELAEIINDFKNNVHSIQQVEKLVEEWKNRNDVQKSFKEKQEQLLQMRLKYEQIQQEMKQSLRKPSPFDRIKKFFRPKPEQKSTEEQIVVPPLVITPAQQTQRPISSLSTSSSGSSGRMSTISGSSLVDSGTHSDNEERKHLMGTPNEDEFRNDLNKAILNLNYTPLPAPKPVKAGIFPNRQVFETIEEKPVNRPDNLSLVNEFYIQFPPSGLPVPGLSEDKEDETAGSSAYMNLSVNGSPLQSHTYMNFKLPTSR